MLKNFLKDIFLIAKIRNRFAPSVQLTQVQLMQQYQHQAIQRNLPAIQSTGFKVFSQFEEDGLLLYLFSVIGMQHKVFVEIGSDDGVNSNSANLFFNFNWRGLFIDANQKSINRGRKFYSKYPHPWQYQPTFVCAKVTAENINQLIQQAGYSGNIGLLSIDIDGNDYWIWKAIEVIQPDVVIIEVLNEFGMHDIVVPYDANFVPPGKHPLYHSASPVAMTKLAAKKGYRLVAANDLGFNFIYIKNELAADLIPTVAVETLLQHPSNAQGQAKFAAIKDWDYITE
jgi:hypothetical protein